MQETETQILLFNALEQQEEFFNSALSNELNIKASFAKNIVEIADILAVKEIDLIVLNHLNDNSIIETIKILKTIPVIFTTEEGNEDLITEAIETGIYSYIIRDKKNNYLNLLASLIKKIKQKASKITKPENLKNSTTIVNELFESRKLLETVVSNAPIIIYFVDNNGLIKLAKGKGLDILKLKEEELLNKTVVEVYPNASKLENIYRNVLSGKVYRGIVEFDDIALDGWISPLIDDIGNISGAISVAFDITALSKTEKALQASEEKYKALIENAPIGILFSDINGNIVDLNQMLVDVLGSPSIEATKKINILTFKNLIDRGFDNDFKLCLKTGKLVISEILYTSRWDKTIYIRYHLTCIYDSNKNVIGIQALVEDITERKLAEIALKESEDLYKTLARNLPNASVLLFDKHLSYKIAEGKALNISDIIRYDGINSNHTKPELTSEYLEAYYTEALKGNAYRFERQYDDNIYLIHTLPVKNESSEIFAGMAVFQDITEQKEYEEKIKASLREKELLLKEINHRVKNNLQIISSLLSLQSGYIKDKKILEIFRESQNRVRTMALIHEELYKTEKLSRVEFKQYAENLTNHLYQSYRISSGKITFKIVSEDIVLDIETAIPLGLIINELVSNSLKYAFKHNQIGEILVNLSKKDNIFELVVADNGIGLPKEVNFRNTASLGLQLIVSLTEQLDGTIELDCEKGTKFIIKFEELKYKERY